MKIAFFIVLLFACGVSAQAQQSPAASTVATAQGDSLPPTGPLLQVAPEFSTWEVVFTYPDEATSTEKNSSLTRANLSEVGHRPKRIVTTKTAKIIHEVSESVAGKKIERWYVGKTQYEKQDDASQWMAKIDLVVNGKLSDTSYLPFPDTGFRDLGWVDAKTYVGTIPLGERKCMIFAPGGAEKINMKVEVAKQKKVLDAQSIIAYVDLETRFPIVLREGRSVRTYRFDVPPTAMQMLPDDLAADIKKGELARVRLLQLAPRPY